MTHIVQSETVSINDEVVHQATDTSSDEDQGSLSVVEDVDMLSAGEDSDDDFDRKSTSEEGVGEDSEIKLMVMDIDAGTQGVVAANRSTSCPRPVMHGPFYSLKAAFNSLATSRKVLPTQDLHRIATAMTGNSPARSRKRKGKSSESTSPPTCTPRQSRAATLTVSGQQSTRNCQACAEDDQLARAERLDRAHEFEIVYGTEVSGERLQGCRAALRTKNRSSLTRFYSRESGKHENAEEQFKLTCKNSGKVTKSGRCSANTNLLKAG